jgi:hypothetical protein
MVCILSAIHGSPQADVSPTLLSEWILYKVK